MNAATLLRPEVGVPADEAIAECIGVAAEAECRALANARAALAQRRRRAKLFGELRLVDGPGWEMLVDLYVHHLEGKSLCIGSVCVTSGVPMTNAVRILTKLVDRGLVCRRRDPADRRRCIVALTHRTCATLDRYFGKADT